MISASVPKAELCWQSAVGGILLCSFLAVIAQSLNSISNVPLMLLALTLGVVFRAAANSSVEKAGVGVDFCARTVLRVGIALLGFRIVATDVLSLGWSTAAIVLGSLIATLCGGYLLARALGQPSDVSVISATSVAVCGASAALAASAVVPSREGLERETLAVIIIVSLLSTIVMIVYPLLSQLLALDTQSTAIFLGAAIHDVAQVAGAGFAISPAVGLDAVTVKMLRVACLLPVIFLIGSFMLTQRSSGKKPALNTLLPAFLLFFLFFASLANLGLLPPPIVDFGKEAAGWAFTVSVAALGLKTSFGDIRCMKPKLVITLIAQTLWQLGCVVFLLLAFR